MYSFIYWNPLGQPTNKPVQINKEADLAHSGAGHSVFAFFFQKSAFLNDEKLNI